MPAADISQVQVTFGNGIKREEYGPLKKAEVTITAIVDTGHDGVAALNYISKIAQDKVRELLTLQGQPAAAAATTPPADVRPEEAVQDAVAGEAQAEPQRRTRRTKAQIEADAAAAAAAQSPPATETPAETAASPSDPSTEDDEWAAAAPEQVHIADSVLNGTCSETAGRLKEGGGIKVRNVIRAFAPEGDEWNESKGGRKFTVNDIPQTQRADFIAKLKALT